jgi:hypothetical protein
VFVAILMLSEEWRNGGVLDYYLDCWVHILLIVLLMIYIWSTFHLSVVGSPGIEMNAII